MFRTFKKNKLKSTSFAILCTQVSYDTILLTWSYSVRFREILCAISSGKILLGTESVYVLFATAYTLIFTKLLLLNMLALLRDIDCTDQLCKVHAN